MFSEFVKKVDNFLFLINLEILKLKKKQNMSNEMILSWIIIESWKKNIGSMLYINSFEMNVLNNFQDPSVKDNFSFVQRLHDLG